MFHSTGKSQVGSLSDKGHQDSAKKALNMLLHSSMSWLKKKKMKKLSQQLFLYNSLQHNDEVSFHLENEIFGLDLDEWHIIPLQYKIKQDLACASKPRILIILWLYRTER